MKLESPAGPVPASIKSAQRNPYSVLGITPAEGALFLLLLGLVYSTTYFYSYLLFHTLVELFSIIIAITIAVITVNCLNLIDNPYLRFVGISSFFTGVLDLVHTISFKGIPIFSDYDYYAPQFWIAARYVEAFSMSPASSFSERTGASTQP